jgi:outer membrane cobalamin receptor
VGKVRLAGLEGELQHNWTPNWATQLSTTYLLNATDEDSKEWLMYRPKLKMILTSTCDHPWGKLEIRSTHIGERPTEVSGITLPPYWTMDLTYTLGILSFFSHNVLDTQYQESYLYPMPGRTVGVEMNYLL